MKVQIIGYVAAFLLFASCSREIGDRIDGKWQMQQIEADGKVWNVDTIYYNFQTSVFMYQIYRPLSDSFSHCYGFKTMETDKQALLELTDYGVVISKFLPQTDWETPIRRFIVEEITAKRLILQSDGKRYIFRRF
ncbi:MAG: lipocalin-like domain-containing protein [Tannerellaceae bacterium]|jgi:hypothetical protein|nr:lipocalin-like domain-containing protein [Tannerellaceae bacterium]